MRRTNVILDETLLEEAKRISGQPTYSATINHALREMVRLNTIAEGMKILGGSHAWEGDLAEMREDKPRMPDDEWWPMVERHLEMIRDTPASGRPKSTPRKRRPRGSR